MVDKTFSSEPSSNCRNASSLMSCLLRLSVHGEVPHDPGTHIRSSVGDVSFCTFMDVLYGLLPGQIVGKLFFDKNSQSREELNRIAWYRLVPVATLYGNAATKAGSKSWCARCDLRDRMLDKLFIASPYRVSTWLFGGCVPL
jgi:hypothetical protein